jgi:hypothetical protein
MLVLSVEIACGEIGRGVMARASSAVQRHLQPREL